MDQDSKKIPTSDLHWDSVKVGILPDWDIRRSITITPFAEGIKRPGKISYGLTSYGYDARLGRTFKVFNPVHGNLVVDPKAIDERIFYTIEDADYCIIPPNSYVLGESLEYFEIPRDITCVCLGKSTLARAGLIVNVTPLESQWRGKVTIEISNSSPLPAKIYAEEGIMQIQFHRAMISCDVSYADKKGKYDNQQGLTLSKVD